MYTNLIAVGNSKGLRLPKAILVQCGLEDRVVLKVTEQGLLISPAYAQRQGWEESIKAECGSALDEELDALAAVNNAFDDEEWAWPGQNC